MPAPSTLRIGNTRYVLDTSVAGSFVSSDVLGVRFDTRGTVEALGEVQEYPPVEFPSDQWENAVNGEDPSYDAYASTTLGAAHYWPADDAAGDLIDTVGGSTAVVSGVVVYEQPGVGLDADQAAYDGSIEFAASGYAEVAALGVNDVPFAGAGHALWFKPTALTGRRCVYQFGDATAGLAVVLDADSLVVCYWSSGGATSTRVARGLLPDSWYFIAVAPASSGETQLFFGDALGQYLARTTTVVPAAGTSAATTGLGANTSTIVIDGQTTTDTLIFGGGLDNVSVYSTLLTRSAMASLYWLGRAGIGAV